MHWLDRLFRSRAWDIVVVALVIWSMVRWGQGLATGVYHYDFNHYYTSSWLLRQGQNPYESDLVEVSRRLGFQPTEEIPRATNPPPLLWLMVPVTYLTIPLAYAAWTAVELGALVWMLWMMWRLYADRLSLRERLLVMALYIMAQPVLWNLCFAHVELVLAAVVMGAAYCLQRGLPVMAVVLISVAAAIKLYPLVLLPWFLWRSAGDWRGWLRSLAVAGVCLLIVVVATRVTLWIDFFRYSLPIVNNWVMNRTFNFSLPSFIGNLARVWHLNGTGALTDQNIIRVVGVLLAGGAYWLVSKRKLILSAEFSLVSVAMVCGGPVAWGYYFCFLLYPATVAAVTLKGTDCRRQKLWCGLAILMMNRMPIPVDLPRQGHFFSWVLMNYSPLYGALILGLLLVLSSSYRPAEMAQSP